MKTSLIFLGTKGDIEESTPKHRYHSSMLVSSGDFRLLVDYGQLRRFSLEEIRPDAILITHAHPDHYAWLYEDLPVEAPVYMSQDTFDYGKYKPQNSRVVKAGQTFEAGPFTCQSYDVMHSIRCPAVGWRIRAGDRTLVYNSDLVDIMLKDNVLAGVDYYIGDGSAIKTNLVRRRDDVLFGHTRIGTQINWCQKFGIPNVIFTHLGKETINKEEEFIKEHTDIVLAYDGLEIKIE